MKITIENLTRNQAKYAISYISNKIGFVATRINNDFYTHGGNIAAEATSRDDSDSYDLKLYSDYYSELSLREYLPKKYR